MAKVIVYVAYYELVMWLGFLKCQLEKVRLKLNDNKYKYTSFKICIENKIKCWVSKKINHQNLICRLIQV